MPQKLTEKQLDRLFQAALNSYQRGDIEQAIHLALQLIKLDKTHFQTLDFLGSLFALIGDNKRAEVFLKKVLRLQPTSVVALNNLGLVLCHEGRHSEAEVLLREAVKLNPEFSEALNNLGFTLQERNEMDEAQELYLRALKIKPEYPEALNNLGVVYRYQQKATAATIVFKNAIRLQPDYALAYYNLSCTKGYELTESEVTAMSDLIEKSDQVADVASLCSGLYNYYSAKKRYHNAFAYLQRGNDAKFKAIGYDGSAEKNIAIIRDSFDEDYLKRLVKMKASAAEAQPLDEEVVEQALEPSPVFIVGMPRSGSSLLEQILTSHPGVAGLGESQSMLMALLRMGKSLRRDVRSYFLQFPKADESRRVKVLEEYHDVIREDVAGKQVYTDKMLTNFMYIGFIKNLLPNAKFLHITRHPMATCFSCYEQYFTRGHEYSFDLEVLARYFIEYEKLMVHWQQLFPEDVLEVRYEELVFDTAPAVQKCLEFIGLEMHENCLKFYDSDRTVMTASTDQVREKIFTGSNEKWKPYKKQLAVLEEGLSLGDL